MAVGVRLLMQTIGLIVVSTKSIMYVSRAFPMFIRMGRLDITGLIMVEPRAGLALPLTPSCR